MQFVGLYNDVSGRGKFGNDNFGTYISECDDIAGYVPHKLKLPKNSVSVGNILLLEFAAAELSSLSSKISAFFPS